MYFMGQKASSNIPRNSMNFYENCSDATLRTEDGVSFRIHRVLLARRSEYFRSLFSFEANSNRKEILIKEIGSQTLREILHCIYEGTLQMDEKNVLDLMMASDCMLLSDLLKQCLDFAIRCMTTSNCLALLTTASRCKKLNNLREFSRYVKVHFQEIVKSFPEGIGDLPIEVLKELLNDNGLNVTSEDTVRMAIVKWVNKDPLNRNRHLPDLVNYIRFEETDHASKMIEESTMISSLFSMEPSQVTHPIIESLFLHENLNRENRLPKYLHVGKHIYQSEIDGKYHTLIYLTSDEELDFWRIVVAEVTVFFPVVIGPVGKYIYLISMDKKVRYDVLEEQLIPIAAMSENRYSFCILELHGMIYALGGRLEPSNNPLIVFMQQRIPGDDVIRHDDDVVMLNEAVIPDDGFIHDDDVILNDDVIPDHDDISRFLPRKTNAIERYDPFTDTWNLIEPIGTMSISAAVAMNGKIYVLGHNGNGLECEMVTRVYDPLINIWMTVKSPRVQRTSFSAVVFQNHLYVIGGYKYESRYEDEPLRSVEEYNPILDEWSFLPSLPVPYEGIYANVQDGTISVFEGRIHPRVRWDGGRRAWQKIESVFLIYRQGILDDPNLVRKLVKKSRGSIFEWKKNVSIKIYD